MNCNNTRVIGVPEEEEREQGLETLFKNMMTENFHNLGKERHTSPGILVQAQRILNKMNPKRPKQRHIRIKAAKLRTKRDS